MTDNPALFRPFKDVEDGDIFAMHGLIYIKIDEQMAAVVGKIKVVFLSPETEVQVRGMFRLGPEDDS